MEKFTTVTNSLDAVIARTASIQGSIAMLTKYELRYNRLEEAISR
jgi:hypothetical protein